MAAVLWWKGVGGMYCLDEYYEGQVEAFGMYLYIQIDKILWHEKKTKKKKRYYRSCNEKKNNIEWDQG